MAGHSKWNNIKRKKEKTDSQKARIFTKMGREIAVAVREGGADPLANGKLRELIAKAKGLNVPNDNITRMLQRASSTDTSNYDNITYEGYGPGGVAVIVEALTDNKNRTAGDVRHHFDKNSGNLGASGCVSWQFAQKGLIVVESEGLDEDEVMLRAIDAGAEDFIAGDGIFEIYTAPEDFSAVSAALGDLEFLSAEIGMVPGTYIKLTDERDIRNMERLLESLEDCDDVQDVWHNWEE